MLKLQDYDVQSFICGMNLLDETFQKHSEIYHSVLGGNRAEFFPLTQDGFIFKYHDINETITKNVFRKQLITGLEDLLQELKKPTKEALQEKTYTQFAAQRLLEIASEVLAYSYVFNPTTNSAIALFNEQLANTIKLMLSCLLKDFDLYLSHAVGAVKYQNSSEYCHGVATDQIPKALQEVYGIK